MTHHPAHTNKPRKPRLGQPETGVAVSCRRTPQGHLRSTEKAVQQMLSQDMCHKTQGKGGSSGFRSESRDPQAPDSEEPPTRYCCDGVPKAGALTTVQTVPHGLTTKVGPCGLRQPPVSFISFCSLISALLIVEEPERVSASGNPEQSNSRISTTKGSHQMDSDHSLLP